MSEKFSRRGVRWLIVGGVGMLFVGGCVAGFADGFGDTPPPISESVRQRRTGIAIAALGIAVAVGSAIRLYIVDNRRSE